ncbi:TetR/AcrR family transcriptional regulator C-terminal domain-containing protein [Amycolatopsis sp. NPDC004625]|uniref:TetR/AcrR family transcriptional regulator n=1 Tax=Amycolatopsis sp. NPDC004625 TaxID=3154670 RepID=UPI0033AD6195
MTTPGKRTPVSSRTRPAKPALSREWIIAATLEIMRRDGLQAATVRRVAQALDTGQSSLYAYVANTTELHAAVLDELMGTLPTPGPGDAGARVRQLVAGYRDLLLAHPGLARSALVLRPSGPNTLRFLDTLLGLLTEAGFGDDRAAWTADLVVLYATALAAEHARPPAGDATGTGDRAGQALFEAVRTADVGTYPHLSRLSAVALGGTPGQRWAWALDVLLADVVPTPLSGKDRP